MPTKLVLQNKLRKMLAKTREQFQRSNCDRRNFGRELRERDAVKFAEGVFILAPGPFEC